MASGAPCDGVVACLTFFLICDNAIKQALLHPHALLRGWTPSRSGCWTMLCVRLESTRHIRRVLGRPGFVMLAHCPILQNQGAPFIPPKFPTPTSFTPKLLSKCGLPLAGIPAGSGPMMPAVPAGPAGRAGSAEGSAAQETAASLEEQLPVEGLVQLLAGLKMRRASEQATASTINGSVSMYV